MDFLPTRKFMDYAKKRSLDFGWTNDDVKKIVSLWHLGWLRADMIESNSAIDEPGIVFLKKGEYSPDLYGDERLLTWREEGYLDCFKTLDYRAIDGELLFHPFRLFILHKIKTLTNQNIDPLVLFSSGNAYRAIANHQVESFDRLTYKEDYLNLIRFWNDVITIAVLVEPVVFNQIFGFYRISRKFPYRNNEQDYHKDFNDTMDSHVCDVKDFLRKCDIEILKGAMADLCREAEIIEPTAELLRLLRLTEGKFRLETLEGRSALAMNMLSMAETIRLGLEMTLGITLPEEDQSGYGWDRASLKKYYYGSDRILRNNAAKVEFVRELGLDYNIILRWYVEGETEYAALMSEFGDNPSVEIINLKGEVIAGKRKGLAFAENLMNDMARSIYSWVSLDSDLSENCKVVKAAAKRGEMFGNFFFATPDFEFENFTLDELVTIVWEIAVELETDPELHSQLVIGAKGVSNGSEFEAAVVKSIPQLNGFSKGEKWGERLMRYARENRKMQVSEITKVRQICEAIIAAHDAIPCNYLLARKECQVNLETGRLENLKV